MSRQILELIALAVVCIASLRAWFWKGFCFTPVKKFRLVLPVAVFLGVALLIVDGH